MSGTDLARYPNLWKRKSAYYLRVRVPADLRVVEKREHIVVSLRTADFREAVKKYRREHGAIEGRFEELRAQLAHQDRTTPGLSAGRLDLLDEIDLDRLAHGWFERRRKSTLIETARVQGPAGEALNELEGDWAELSQADPEAHGEMVRRATDRLLVEAGFASARRALGAGQAQVPLPSVDRTTAQYGYLSALVRRALLIENARARGAIVGRSLAHFDPIFNPLERGPTSPIPLDDAARGDGGGVTVRVLIAAYRKERERSFGEESTDRKYGHIFRALEEAFGPDQPIRSIKRDDCRQVRDLLRQVPAHCGKKYPGLSLREAISAAERDGAPKLAPNTVGSYLNNLSAILNWAVREEWIDRNPAKGLIEKNRPSVKRRGFTPSELKTVFDALVVERAKTPSRYWVPALALYTGARAGELCQLRADDVVAVGEVHCLDLSEFDAEGRRVDDKSLKTGASARLVPLHPHLVESGFLRFVERQREAGSERLFPDLRPGAKDNHSHEFSKWFGRFMDRIGLKQPALVFHSFRHGFRDACRLADIPEETARALGGWAAASQAARYGDRGMVPVLDRAIRKVAFDEFRLQLEEKS